MAESSQLPVTAPAKKLKQEPKPETGKFLWKDATQTDIPELAQIIEESFVGNQLLLLMPKNVHDRITENIEIIYQFMENPAVMITKVVHEDVDEHGTKTEKISGFAIFTVVDTRQEEVGVVKMYEILGKEASEFGQKFWKEKARLLRNYMGGIRFMICDCIAVRPKYRYRGVGRMLIQNEVDVANEDETPLFLQLVKGVPEVPPGSNLPVHNLFDHLQFTLLVESRLEYPKKWLRKFGWAEYVLYNMVRVRGLPQPGNQTNWNAIGAKRYSV